MARAHAVGTIVARNYIAQARVLAASFAEHHPEVRFHTLVIDGAEDDRSLTGLGTVLLPHDLPIPRDVLHAMNTIYDVMEFATALKPAMLLHFHHRNALTSTYFDPDIRVYGRLDDIFSAAEKYPLVVTPHTRQPVPRDGRRLNEADIMHAGMYNLGFIATGPRGLRFLGWWHDRLTTDAVVDLHNALFTDQRWVDWAPSFEDLHVLRDPGLNAAYWNLHERRITRTPDGTWWAGDRPLRFFHFSGYDPARPWLLSKHLGEQPRTLLSENHDLRALCDGYGAELVELGHVRLRREAYRNAKTADGLVLTSEVRRLYRDSLLGREPRLEGAPDPQTEGEAFRSWLLAPVLPAQRTRISRFEYGIWRSRADLHGAFPDPFGAHAAGFRNWLDTDATAANHYRALGESRDRWTEPARAAEQSAVDPGWGWSVAGYARAELGVGEAGRRIAQAVARTGVPWQMVGLTEGPQSRQEHRYHGALADRAEYSNQLLCVNADMTPRLVERMGARPRGGRRVGYWFWELSEFPETFAPAFDVVDEVWVASEFNRAAVQARTDKPVRVVHLPVPVRARPTSRTRAQLGLPEDRQVFVTIFDHLSVMARKNPIAVIEAYRSAFGPDENTCLVVKSINGHLRPLEREQLRLAAHGRPDIVLMEHYLSGAEVAALVELADCLVSLHRSEGYGLNLVDAMAAGTPVVATAYSGNMEFMTPETGFLVPYDLIEVGRGAEPYDPRAVWAEPDTTAAAEAMRAVVDDHARARAVAAAARTHVTSMSAAAVAEELAPLLLGLAIPDRVPS